MRLYCCSVLLLVFFLASSCSILDKTNSSEVKVSGNTPLEILEKSENCPDYFIPKNTSILRNKKNEQILKLYSVKLECKKEANKNSNLVKKVIITQTIYYQVLIKNLYQNSYGSRVYTALVDEEKYDIKFKILSKIKSATTVKTKNKVFFKNTNTFKMNSYEDDNKLIFYYGFQS